jgi:hypothetical protein
MPPAAAAAPQRSEDSHQHGIPSLSVPAERGTLTLSGLPFRGGFGFSQRLFQAAYSIAVVRPSDDHELFGRGRQTPARRASTR